jgi:DNA-3-methyladenine glycosylase II
MRDLKPPRYPDLFETCANAILFQQVSLHAASAIMRRLIVALGRRSGRLDDERDEIPQYVLP